MKKKIGFLFGAGAEADYGLPTGGRFALDIFRYDQTMSKENFKKMRANIDKATNYANNWLPRNFDKNNISSYGKKVFETIIKDTIEHNRKRIIKSLNEFDEFAENEVKKMKSEKINITEIIEKNLAKDIRDSNMGQIISFVDVFDDGNKIFSNNYFSALLELYKKKDFFKESEKYEMGKILTAILQLQVGALSENLTRNINDSLFKEKDDDIDIFDDLGEIIQLNYQSSGLSGIEYLLENRKYKENTESAKILEFSQKIIESIYSSVLDYKSLIDSNWHYLYCPMNEWAKFCKISIFLWTVREYILSQAQSVDFKTTKSYYDDLKKVIDSDEIDVTAIATTNYNTFISDILNKKIIFMNGSVNMWYDPYLNKIETKDILDVLNQKGNHFLVPLLFTQSGTKPMTSITMAKNYVETYESWRESDYLVIVGFGFNLDDEHINGIIRTLINDDNKKIIVIRRKKESTNVNQMKKEISDKLKINKKDNIIILELDKNRNINGSSWIEFICKDMK